MANQPGKPDFSNVSGGGESTAEAAQPDFGNVQAGAGSSAPSARTAAASGAAGTQRYTVKAGDSLSRIAREAYGDASRWREIYEANRDTITNPDLIHPGQVINLPGLPDPQGGSSA